MRNGIWSFLMLVPTFVDHLTSNVMLPAGGLAIALFVGWAVPARNVLEALGLSAKWEAVLGWMLRVIVPLGIGAVALAPFLG